MNYTEYIKTYKLPAGTVEKRPSWQNIVIGASVAEAPAIMTASGFYQDLNRNWNQDLEREGLNELRKSLSEIGIEGVATFTGEALVAAAAKYIPKVLAKVGPKLLRFKKLSITSGFGDPSTTTTSKEALATATDAFEQRMANGAVELIVNNGDPTDVVHIVPNMPKENLQTIESLREEVKAMVKRDYPDYNPTIQELDVLVKNYINGGGYTSWNPNISGSSSVTSEYFPNWIKKIYTKNPEYVTNAIKHHETNHAIHTPMSPAEGFKITANPQEMSSMFTELKDFNKITNPKTDLTPEMFYNFRDNYFKLTGADPNRYGFIDNVIDLEKALKWERIIALGSSQLFLLQNLKKVIVNLKRKILEVY